MLAWFLYLGLAIELLFYGVSGLVLWYYVHIEPQVLVLLALTAAISVRTLAVAGLFLITWIYRAEKPLTMRVKPWRAIYLVVAELGAFLIIYSALHPLSRWLVGRHPLSHNASDQLPVLLIHGYCCNAGFWWSMERYLRRRGVANVFTVNLEPVFGDIDQYAQQVALWVEQTRALTGSDRVILVGHSMGGIVARAYIHWYGGKRYVAKLITLGSPHQGTEHARFAFINSVSVKQMRPQNPWLTKLNRAETNPLPVPIVSIYSYHDNLIAPPQSSALPYAHSINQPLVGLGHLAMAFSKRCQALVYQQIQETKIAPSPVAHAAVAVELGQDPQNSPF